MENVITWVTENYLIVFGIIGGLLVAAKAATKLTKSTKDDEIVGRIEDVVEKVEDFVKRDEEK